ncbi:MAG TPA: hypothetical protein PLP50_00345 [Thermoanaerobaculia bacterium]|nr:hypothetical protein [Thermoanaerobaculia bacterium]HQN06615.1 hypothetical protein [Thermoanaerobaculia bacterium]HQP84863.1 hypothetical protein [Thermoanaerobaculia bacterium]
MRHTRLLCVIACLAFPATSTAQPVDGPVFEPPTSRTDSEDWPPAQSRLPADAGPGFLPATPDLLAAHFSLKREGTAIAITSHPFRVGSQRALWGIRTTGGYDSGEKTTGFGLGYRFEWRWLFAAQWTSRTVDAHRRAAEMTSSVSDEKRAAEVDRAMLRIADLETLSLIPILTVGYQIDLFPARLGGTDASSMARGLASLNLSWRYGVYVDVESNLSIGHQRADETSPLVGLLSAGAVLLVTIPELLGATAYDDYYRRNLLQRGVSVGPAFSYQECRADAAEQAACPKGLIRDRLVGAAIELRVADKVTPRFTVGKRRLWTRKSDTSTGEDFTEGSVSLTYTFR